MANPDRETLRVAAESAARLIAKYEQTITRCQDKIAPLQAIIEAWDAVCGRRSKNQDRIKVDGEATTPNTRNRRGLVPDVVAKVLATGEDLGEPEIRARVEQMLGVRLTRATVYSALRRGKELNRYEQTGQRWRLRPEGEPMATAAPN